MSKVVFRLARPGEEGRIVDFINEHFDMRLPLINRPEFFHHYYAGRDGCPQFALAEEGDTLLSAAGYILASAAPHPDVWVSVWVAVKGHNGVGLELMNALPDLLHANVVACNNIRAATCNFYRFLGWTATRLPHYYRLAPRPQGGYRLAQPDPALSPAILPVKGGLLLENVPSAAALVPLGMPETPHTPVKDSWYLRRRYFHYPHFTYDVWAARAEAGGPLLAYLITRTVTAADTGLAPVLRLVDYIGKDEHLPRLGLALDALLQQTGAEYIDCYCAGIPPEIWAEAGFYQRKISDAAIIPNYLTPPLAENTEYYYFTNKPDNFVLFKADGDQDRPNLAP
ncbi:MAG: hypothetical protein PHO10_06675 [Gemmiger sp.]|nr:hypothetical protein [Gemmiger sp.]